MCGIAGYLRTHHDYTLTDVIARMTRALAHRGPDDEGLALFDTTNGRSVALKTDDTAPAIGSRLAGAVGFSYPHRLALGHRRFSIVDLSPAAHQPFSSSDGRFCVSFNGEIYNYVELRRELMQLGHRFHTSSDTEVLIEAFRAWGPACFNRFNGFWAIALYDAHKRALLLSRDRFGKAPMFVARTAGALWWGSEIGAILAATGRGAFHENKQALSDFLMHSWSDLDDTTFYDGIDAFPAASYAWVKADGAFTPERYWQLPNLRLRESEISPTEAAAELRSRLGEAMRLRLRADVPVGFQLSGGVDSSALVAAAASRGFKMLACTVSYPGTAYDEEPYARAVRDRYPNQLDYRVLQPPMDDFWRNADASVGLIGEPFHAPNTLTQFEVWREMTRMGVRVVISGAAGDELLAGYPRDYYLPFLRHLLAEGSLTRLHREITRFSERPASPFSADYFKRVMQMLRSEGAHASEPGLLVSTLGSKSHFVPQGLNPIRRLGAARTRPAASLEQILEENMGSWRMNYWTKVGNLSSMGVPIELRCPLLDYRVAEFAFSLPVTYLIRDGWMKWILREAVKDILPAEVVWRKKKMGFPFPYTEWARASRETFFSLIGSVECPYVDPAGLSQSYDQLAELNPIFLWRVMSVCLWWKKCVLGESLSRSSARQAA